MCSPAIANRQYSGTKTPSLFDAKRKTLCQEYKSSTADLSQVCDGRNLELFRQAQAAANTSKSVKVKAARNKSSSKSKTKASIDDHVDASDDDKDSSSRVGSGGDTMKNRVIASYRPVTARSSSRNCNGLGSSFRSQGSQEDQEVEQQKYIFPVKQKQRVDKTPLCFSHEEAPRSPPVNVKQNRDDDKKSQRATRTSLDEVQSTQREGASPTKGDDQQKEDQEKGSPSQPVSTGTSRRRGRTSESNSNEDRRRSSSSRRRHSDEGNQQSKNSLPRKGDQSRRLSVDSNTNSSSSSTKEPGSRATVRKLSEPMHRCSTTNQKLSGIMRSARYSSNNLAAMATQPTIATPTLGRKDIVNNSQRQPTIATPTLGGKDVVNDRQRRRSATIVNSTSFTESSTVRKFDLGLSGRVIDPPPLRTKSCHNFNDPTVQDATREEWVASGVKFSKSMEVYLFKR